MQQVVIFSPFTHTQEMERRGIGISTEGVDAVKAHLEPDADPAIVDALDKVCSGSLTFQPLPWEPQKPYVSCQILF